MKRTIATSALMLYCASVHAGGLKGPLFSDEEIKRFFAVMGGLWLLSSWSAYAYRTKARSIYFLICLLLSLPFLLVACFLLVFNIPLGLLFFIPLIVNVTLSSKKKNREDA